MNIGKSTLFLPLVLILLLLISYHHGVKSLRIVNYIRNVRQNFKPINWVQLVSESLVIAKKVKGISVDFTAGAVGISSPEIVVAPTIGEMITTDDTLETTIIGTKPSPLLQIHQLGRNVIRKVPNNALFGVLVLIASELLNREVSKKNSLLPPLMQEIANTTVNELDMKLESLSSLNWNIDPFLQAEFENLQTQPLEVIDKFVVTEILPRIDKELSPMLSKLTTDPKQVTAITKNIKDLVQVGAFLIVRPGKENQPWSPFEKTTNKLIEKVDLVGQGVEVAVNDWNRIIEELSTMVKADSIVKLLSPSLVPATYLATISKLNSKKEGDKTSSKIPKAAQTQPTNIITTITSSSSSSSSSSSISSSQHDKLSVKPSHDGTSLDGGQNNKSPSKPLKDWFLR